MNRLTQQKYDLTCALMKLGFEIHSGNEHLLFAAVDAYAVARESREIAELKADNARWCKDFYKVKFELETAEAEIKRLRDFTEKCHKSPEKLVQVVWFADGSFDYCDLVPLQDAAAIALSPAPVTEGPMVQDNYCPLCIGTGKEIGVYEIGICSCRTTISPLNEDQE